MNRCRLPLEKWSALLCVLYLQITAASNYVLDPSAFEELNQCNYRKVWGASVLPYSSHGVPAYNWYNDGQACGFFITTVETFYLRYVVRLNTSNQCLLQ